MADSVDRVFVHALNTVKKIPRTGSARPPPADRLRLYGLYKQAMEGDVDGVMDRPGVGKDADVDTIREQEKWDAWDAQKGVSRTEAKRRYIEALIDTMHKYASTTRDAKELVAELEFVWDQIKNNSTASSHSSPGKGGLSYNDQQRIRQAQSKGHAPMKVLSPMSQDDEEERDSRRLNFREDDEFDDDNFETPDGATKRTKKWRRKIEATLVKMTAEMAALREQILTGQEWKGRRRRTVGAWIGWFLWTALRHLFVDAILLGLTLIFLRKVKERRLEDLVRDWLRSGRAYVRRMLPTR